MSTRFSNSRPVCPKRGFALWSPPCLNAVRKSNAGATVGVTVGTAVGVTVGLTGVAGIENPGLPGMDEGVHVVDGFPTPGRENPGGVTGVAGIEYPDGG